MITSGAANGEVKVWDLRTLKSVTTFQAHKEGMSAMAVHPATPIMATGSSHIAIHKPGGELLNTIKCHDGFMGHRIGPVCSLTMHPLSLLLAAGGADAVISVYTQ
uniref:Pre-mRNA-processing factor 19 n=1 Tax=Hemiselmis andersenii TaxID=464988 RepID=A0A7S1GX77_HEMAN